MKKIPIVLLALYFLSIPISANASWSASKTLASYTLFALPTNTATVVVKPNGDTVAIWINEASYKIQAAERKGSVWSAPKTVYPASVNKGEITGGVHAVAEPNGNVTVIFSSTTPGTIRYCTSGGRVFRCKGPDSSFAKTASLANGSTSWSKATNISQQGIIVSDTQIGVDKSGNLLAFWKLVQNTGVNPVLQATTRQTAQWNEPQTLYSTSNKINLPCLAKGSNGEALLAWQENMQGQPNSIYIRSSRMDQSGIWNPVEDIEQASSTAWTLDCAMNANGRAAVIWDAADSVKLANFSQNTGWQQAQTLQSDSAAFYGINASTQAYSPNLSMDDNNDVLVTWVENDTLNNLWTIEVQMQRNNGQTIKATFPTNVTYVIPSPQVALNGNGNNGLLAWVDSDDSTIYSAVFSTTNNWSLPVKTGTAIWGTNIVLGSGYNDNISAVWVSGDVTRYLWRMIGATYTF